MAQSVTLWGASYTNVPALTVPKTGGGTARFDDASVTTATAGDVASGKVFLASDGTITTGTASGGGGELPEDQVAVFTTHYDDQHNLSSITCNKTFSELQSADEVIAIYADPDPDDPEYVYYATMAGGVHSSSGSTYYKFYMPSINCKPTFQINYAQNGTITWSTTPDVYDTLNVTANGTYNTPSAKIYSSVVVDVPTSGGGGDTNFVTGTFTTGSSTGTTGSTTIPYSGSGYPIMAVVVVDDGAYNSSVSHWYSSVQRYAVGQWTMTKSVFTSAPTYSTSGSANYGVTTAIYKNSASSSTSYSRTSGMNTNVFSSSNAANAALTCVRFKSKTNLSYYVASSSYGLLAETTYRYFIYYSS